MESVLNGISTIIFDLGGVVLNLDPDRTANKFSQLSGKTVEEIYQIFLGSTWVPAFERGKISPEEFRNQVRVALKVEISEDDIDEAWNAMLLDLPKDRLELISGLRANYKTLVLSNTNDIHVKAFTQIVAEATGGRAIHHYFDKVYYSNEIGMRKPDREIYDFVLKSNNLSAVSTLFLDDMLPNIEAADECGIKTVHLTDQKDLFKIFS